MRLNPEFQRNIWLELTPHRLLGMPIVLGAIFLITHLTMGFFSEGTASTAVFLFFILTVIWGSKLSSETVRSEIRDKTWDSQRMTTIGPWSMSWGKLLGSTIFTWYGGLLCIVVLTVSSSNTSAFGSYLSVPDNLQRACILVLIGLLAQSAALYMDMIRTAGRGQTGGYSSTPGMLLGIILALIFIRHAIPLPSESTIEWFGQIYNQASFIIFTLVFFSGWAVIGIYRLMRRELQVANTPVVWLLFLIILPGFINGFIEESSAYGMERLDTYLLTIYFTTGLIIYFTILAEPKDPVTFRRLAFQMRHGGGKKILHHMPGWLSGLLLLGLVIIAIHIRDIPAVSLPSEPFIYPGFFTIFLFIIRDICIFLFFNFSSKTKRADTVSLIYLFLLYMIIPLIFSLLEAEQLSAAFTPWNTQGSITVISGLIQSGAMVYLAYRRWNTLSIQA